MKGLILSGGAGSRLRPITYNRAKQLIPVANKPTVFYGIEALVDCGIKEIAIIVGDTKKEIMAAIGDGSRWGVKISYIEQEAPLGLAHAVKIARPYLKDEPFIMYLGDNILKEGMKSFVAEFTKLKPAASILVTPVANPQQFGVVELDEQGQVKRLVEKPKDPPSNLALVGVYFFTAPIFQAIEEIKPSWRNELEITDAIQKLLDKDLKVTCHQVQGWWKDTGKPEDLLEANRLILETIENDIKGEVDDKSNLTGRIQCGTGTKIVNSTVRGPVVIGKNCLIKDAYIGPFTALSDGVTVEGSEIEHSIVMADSKIVKIKGRIDASIIGHEVQVLARDTKPATHRFVLGDRSDLILA